MEFFFFSILYLLEIKTYLWYSELKLGRLNCRVSFVHNIDFNDNVMITNGSLANFIGFIVYSGLNSQRNCRMYRITCITLILLFSYPLENVRVKMMTSAMVSVR